MQTIDAELSTEERLHELAAILAKGLLRLACSSYGLAKAKETDPENLQDTSQIQLDNPSNQSVHVVVVNSKERGGIE